MTASRTVAIFCAAASLALRAGAEEQTWSFDGGTARREGDGVIVEQNGRELKIEACFVAKGWAFRTIPDAIRDVSSDKGRLKLSFRAVSPAGARWQDDLPMLVVVRGDASGYPDGRLRLGGTLATFDKSNVWGWGARLDSDTFGLCLSAGYKMSLSFWNKPETKVWSVRFHTKGEAQADGSTLYEETLEIMKGDFDRPAKDDSPKAKPVDMVAQKRVQYGRILLPPQERGFDPAAWLERIESPDLSQEDVGKLEDLLDARSRLYDAAERARRAAKGKSGTGAAAEEAVAAGYAALNAMDLSGAVADCEKLEEIARGAEPPRANPFTWVKSFTQWGYMRHPEGTGVYEPDPWNLQWEDGFRFNVAQDPRVKIANLPEGPTRFFETRFSAPMSDVKTERSWTGTRWLMPGGSAVEFSLLVPFVDVDGTDVLSLGGFAKVPDRLVWFSPEGLWRGLELTGRAAPRREVLETVLEEAPQDRPAARPAPSKGEQAINPADVGRPWLMLECGGAAGLSGDLLAVFPGARPVSAKFEKGVFTLRLEKKSYVSVLRLRDNLHPQEQAEVCEFFARVAAAPPASCEETVEDGRVVWKYARRVRENAWGVSPRRIAPVPPLADYADLSAPGSRKFKYPTKWGLYRYREGDTSEAALPAAFLSRRAPRRGVNYRLAESPEALEAHVAAGARSFRLCIGGRSPLDESCAKLEALLSDWEGRGVTFLIDPHGAEYKSTWADGFGDGAAQAKFLALWERLSQIGGRHVGLIEGYDLYNEPGLVAGAEGGWKELNERAAAVIRKNHPGAAIYYSSVYAGNPNGLFNLEPLAIEPPQTITCHFYTPHSFSHQKFQTKNAGGDTCVFYPGWCPQIDWKRKIHYGGTTVTWFDRWSLEAVLLPAFEHCAEFGLPLHFGEFGVIGYANQKSPRSALCWTRDAVKAFEKLGADWHLWNEGFGLRNPLVREYIEGLW